jgi:maltose alpha-D-glucosyltransferase/alpha-amylase
MDYSILDDWRQDTQWERGDSVLLCEANVERTEVVKYTAGRAEGPNDRAQMLFDFVLNPKIWLALARADAEPLIEALTTELRLPEHAQWATFLRNHDELDLSRLTDEQRGDVMHVFAPKADMQLYGRGLRRRLAPMMRGDLRRTQLAFALQFSLPGTPVVRYGEEIGMGEDLSLPGREAIRTPMQWDDGPNAGFSKAQPGDLVRPVITQGAFGKRRVNVRAQQRDPNSLLRWFENLVHTLREAPEIGAGRVSIVDVPLPRSVLAHRLDHRFGSILCLHNLAAADVTVDIGRLDGGEAFDEAPYDLLLDGPYAAPGKRLTGLQLRGHGYRWIRLRRSDDG